MADRRSRPRSSIIVGAPVNHRAARTRHLDAGAVEAAVRVTAALVLRDAHPKRSRDRRGVSLVKPSYAPDLAPQRERPPELNPDRTQLRVTVGRYK